MEGTHYLALSLAPPQCFFLLRLASVSLIWLSTQGIKLTATYLLAFFFHACPVRPEITALLLSCCSPAFLCEKACSPLHTKRKKPFSRQLTSDKESKIYKSISTLDSSCSQMQVTFTIKRGTFLISPVRRYGGPKRGKIFRSSLDKVFQQREKTLTIVVNRNNKSLQLEGFIIVTLYNRHFKGGRPVTDVKKKKLTSYKSKLMTGWNACPLQGYTMPSCCPLAEQFAALYVQCRVQRGPRTARTLACAGLFEEHVRRLPEHKKDRDDGRIFISCRQHNYKTTLLFLFCVNFR